MEANNQVENIARITANIILGIGILSGIIITITGLTYLDSYSSREEALAGAYIVYGLIDIVSAIVFWVFVNLLVNISLKLDSRAISLAPHSIQAMAELLKEKSENKPKDPIQKQVAIPTTPKEDAPKYAEDAVAKLKILTDDEVDNEALGEILANNISQARYILMTKKGMTMNQADVYIEKIKSEIK